MVIELAKGSTKKAVENPRLNTVCLICHRHIAGVRIADDPVIRTIRRVKKSAGLSTGNIIVICSDDTQKYQAKRAGFEKALLQYGAAGLIILVVLTLLSQSVGGFIAGLLLGLFVLGMALLRYVPALEKK